MIERIVRSMAAAWLVVLLAVPSTARALDADQSLEQLHHTVWGASQGLSGLVMAVAQTSDGYLWVGTLGGLYRFNGVRFERFQPEGAEKLRSNAVFSLVAPKTGGLWIGYRYGGASFLKDGVLRNYGEADGFPSTTLFAFAIDHDDRVWAAVGRGLLRFDGRRWEKIDGTLGYPKDIISLNLAVDRDGTLWTTNLKDIRSLSKHATAFRTGEPLARANFALSPSNRLWVYGIEETGIQPIGRPDEDVGPSGMRPGARLASQRMFAALFDRDGNLWYGTRRGLSREAPLDDRAVPASQANSDIAVIGPEQGLSGSYIQTLFEDREGSIWVGTNGGLDQFRRNRVDVVPLGVAPSRIAIAPASDGDVWITDYYRGVSYYTAATKRLERFPDSGEQVTAAAPDGRGGVWLGQWARISRRDRERAVPLALPEGRVDLGAEVNAIAEDASGAVWISTNVHGLERHRDGRWTSMKAAMGEAIPPDAIAPAADGAVWFGIRGRAVRYADDRVTRYGPDEGLAIGDIRVIAAHGGRVWVGGENGVARLDGTRFTPLVAADDDALLGVSGIVETASGDLWLNGSAGIAHVVADELRRAQASSGYRVRVALYTALDGLPGTAAQARPLPTAVEAGDGRLWFALTNGLVTIDPRRAAPPAPAPSTAIESLVAGGVVRPARAGLLLPKGTKDLEINYAALSFAVPERVRFRYRLIGSDAEWRETGARRSVAYTNLGPGDYRFVVKAANGDGVWDDAGAELAFAIEAAFWQTRAFQALCAVALVALLWLLYRWRMRRIASDVRDRLEVRVAERERIARELHDTFLQSTIGLVMHFQSLAARVPDDQSLRHDMEGVLDDADRVLAEGRMRVQGLRAHQQDAKLAEAIVAHAANGPAKPPTAQVDVTVLGDERPLREEAWVEALQIGREALANALRHADAARIEIELAYAPHTFTLRVRDDGVGIADAVLARGGEANHYGLPGMKERAALLGGRLTVWSRAGSGTEIELAVPAATAYRDAPTPRRWYARLLRPFGAAAA